MVDSAFVYITAGIVHPGPGARRRAFRALGTVLGNDLAWRRGLRSLGELNPDVQRLCIGYFHRRRDHPRLVSALARYVESGGSFLALHGVSASFKGSALLEELLGGVFNAHDRVQPLALDCCEAGVRSANPERPSQKSWSVVDEPYEHRVSGEVNVVCRWRKLQTAPVAASHAEPCAWKRRFGSGRVGYLSLGHRGAVWTDPHVRAILGSLIQWCRGGDAE